MAVLRKGYQEVEIPSPAFSRVLFDTTKFAWLWAALRIYLGYQWLESGLGKLGNPAWMNGGEALKGFWTRAVATDPKPVIKYDWYRSFIQGLLDAGSYTWFAKLIVFGEILVGAALILGLLTGIAAFFGGFMNINFMLAGTASSNPVLYTIAILLMLAWKVAGYWGVDYYLLPVLGTPWGKPRLKVRETGSA